MYFLVVILKYLKLISRVTHNIVRCKVQCNQNQVPNFNSFQNHSKQLSGSKEIKFGKPSNHFGWHFFFHNSNTTIFPESSFCKIIVKNISKKFQRNLMTNLSKEPKHLLSHFGLREFGLQENQKASKKQAVVAFIPLPSPIPHLAI